MPKQNIGGGGGAPPRKAPPPRVVPHGGGGNDINSSGGNYGIPAANRYKRAHPAPPVRHVAPQHSSVFGPISQPSPIIKAQRSATRQATHAANRLPNRPQLLRPAPITNINQARRFVQSQGRRILHAAVAEGHQGKPDAFGAMLANSNQHDRQVLLHYRDLAHQVDQYNRVDAQRRSGMSPSEFANRISAQVKPGPPHARLHLPGATVDLTNVSRGVGHALAGNPASAFIKGTSKLLGAQTSGKSFGGRVVNDAIASTVGAVPATVKLASDLVHHGPGRAFHDVADPLAQMAMHPGQAIHDHPLFFLQALHGGLSLGGRTAGALSRTATAGRVGGTARESVALTPHVGNRIVQTRSYSKDLIRKQAQKAYDRHRTLPGATLDGVATRRLKSAGAQTRALHEYSDYGSSRPNSWERVNRDLQAKFGRQVAPVRQHRGGRIGQRIGAGVDRTLQSQSAHDKLGRVRTAAIGSRGLRPERDVVTMVHEGVLRSPRLFVRDLQKERTRLEVAYKSMRSAEGKGNSVHLAANREKARLIDKVLADPKARANAKGVFASARALATRLNETERAAIKDGSLDPAKAERSKLFGYAISHMGAVYDNKLGLVRPVVHDGQIIHNPLSNEAIYKHMQSTGTDPSLIAYLPHHLNLRGAKAYHQAFGKARPNYEGAGTRTGAMFARGSNDYTYTHALETLVGKTGKLGNIHEFDKMVSEAGIRHPDGRMFTFKEAQQYAAQHGQDSHGNAIPGDMQLVPVRAHGAKLTEQQQNRIEELQNVPSAHNNMTDTLLQARQEAPVAGDAGAENVVLLPKGMVDRMEQHVTAAKTGSFGAQRLNSAFRRTVLPFSTKWVFGNTFEAAIRLAANGALPQDPVFGRKLFQYLGEMDAHAAAAAKAELAGRQMFGRKGLTVRRDVTGSRARALADFPLVKELRQSIVAATDTSFAMNGLIEGGADYTAMGMFARRQIQEMSGSWRKATFAQEAALRDVAKGLLNTPKQVEAARYLDEVLGKYSRFSPKMRARIQSYAPFLPWYINAVRFTMLTLPLKHPIKTALINSAVQTFQKDITAEHKDVPAGSLKSAIPHNGGFIDVQRFTPWGYTGPVMSGDKTAALSFLMPQVQGVQNALQGQDPFGNKFPKGTKHAGLIAANSALEELVPGITIARRLREGGKTGLPDSTLWHRHTKPGSAHGRSALGRIFNPFEPTYLKPGKGGGSSGPLDYSKAKAGGAISGIDWSKAKIAP